MSCSLISLTCLLSFALHGTHDYLIYYFNTDLMLLEFIIKISCKISFFCVFIAIMDEPVLNLAKLLIILILWAITNKYCNILTLWPVLKEMSLKYYIYLLYSTREFKYIQMNRYFFWNVYDVLIPQRVVHLIHTCSHYGETYI